MSKIIWACPACWQPLTRLGARLLDSRAADAGCYCANCRSSLEPHTRLGRFLITQDHNSGQGNSRTP